MDKPTTKNLICSFLLLLLVVPALGDKVVLKEGKVLIGKITAEDDEEITINLGPSMYLRVEKSKIKEIQRKKKKKRDVRTITLEDVSAEQKKPPEKEDKPKEKPKEKKKEKSDLVQIEPSELSRLNKKANIVFYETLLAKSYEVDERSFEKVSEAIFNRRKGMGFLKKRKRMASKTELQSSWGGTAKKEQGQTRWQDVIVRATMTTTSPYWKAPKNLKEDDKRAWNEFIEKVRKHDQGHRDIYLRGMIRLGESLSALRAPNEAALREQSQKIYATLLKRLQKRQSGHDRRGQVSPFPSNP